MVSKMRDPMQKLGLGALVLLAATMVCGVPAAKAHVSVGIGIGLPVYAPYYAPPAYYGPPAYYYAPPIYGRVNYGYWGGWHGGWRGDWHEGRHGHWR